MLHGPSRPFRDGSNAAAQAQRAVQSLRGEGRVVAQVPRAPPAGARQLLRRSPRLPADAAVDVCLKPGVQDCRALGYWGVGGDT